MNVTLTDLLAAYAAVLATGLAVWDVVKYLLDRAKLRVTCYVAEIFTSGVGRTERNLLAYNIANVGGKPIVVTTIGGSLRSGKHFMILQDALPKTLQPGEAVTLTGQMPEDIEAVEYFIVHDALGTKWKASTKGVKAQLQARPQ
jgi:hypothetical protein